MREILFTKEMGQYRGFDIHFIPHGSCLNTIETEHEKEVFIQSGKLVYFDAEVVALKHNIKIEHFFYYRCCYYSYDSFFDSTDGRYIRMREKAVKNALKNIKLLKQHRDLINHIENGNGDLCGTFDYYEGFQPTK